ncbi:MAG TPA: glycine betaine ABC transporter substrate-binding protein [Candidatus Acidoferrales bacterium]|nr:glycine betaine ABC transporter substrate-binding protein [Candidatus Acidoferrales bacterium]
MIEPGTRPSWARAFRGGLLLLGCTVLFLQGCRAGHQRPIVVGSKNFTEQIVLAELLAQEMESRSGLPVERRVNLGGTLICHEALRAGQIDLYVEYTGTALTVVLGEQPSSDPAEVYQRVKAHYAQRFGLEVTEPLGFNNTFAIVVRGADARDWKLRTISDLAPHAPRMRAGFGYEFMERPDGFRGWSKTYGLKFAEPPRIMDLGLIYRALKEKQVDVVAGNSTDGAIGALDLAVLEDDRHYFPPYQAVPIVRREAPERHPELRAVLGQLSGRLSEADMRGMNYAVDGEHRDVALVVGAFRRAKGL